MNLKQYRNFILFVSASGVETVFPFVASSKIKTVTLESFKMENGDSFSVELTAVPFDVNPVLLKVTLTDSDGVNLQYAWRISTWAACIDKLLSFVR